MRSSSAASRLAAALAIVAVLGVGFIEVDVLDDLWWWFRRCRLVSVSFAYFLGRDDDDDDGGDGNDDEEDFVVVVLVEFSVDFR